ncbi:MAG TPA: flippase-like domain-containing protein [Thermoleophilaceae bacterium]|nr:flippase-like domain-containing protein [Thermoleophilaceae bacterium]
MSAAAIVRRGLLLAVTGVSLYLLAPAILNVFGAWDQLDDVNPLWFVAMLLLQAASYGCMWAVQRLSLRTKHWGPVVTSQLASNAFGRVVPGGVAAAGAMQYTMLTRAGVPAGAAASGMTAASVLVFATLCALPVLAVPAVLGGAPVDPGLARAAAIGGAVFVLMFGLGALCFIFDRPLVLLGRGAQWARNRVLARREPLHNLPARLLRERDVVREVLGRKWWEALLAASGRWLFDYATLLAALNAVGAHPRPSLVLLAFFAAQLLGTLPLTPGGLGFVEAGLTGTLALAGVGAGRAVVATLAYRLVSFWLPIPAGGVAALLHRRLYDKPGEP